MPLKLDAYNDAVKNWGSNATQQFKATASGYNITHRADSPSPSPSINKFRNKYFQNTGAIERISIAFPRSLIYTHKGAGKGRGGTKGSRWVDKYGTSHTTNPKSFGKMATEGRTAKPFINDVLDGANGVEELATIAAEHLGDVITGSLFIK
jgi:hypothetical protein